MKRLPVQILSEYVEGINTMIDACSQMATCHRLSPKWIAMRDILHIVKKATVGRIDKNGGI